MAAVPDELIVWNEIMKREAREFHDYPPERVHVAGVAHFDVYARPEAPGDRDRFFRANGLDTGRRLITLGTVTPWLFPYNADVAEILARAIEEGRFGRPVQLMIRLHPQVLQPGTQHTEHLERYTGLAARFPHVRLDVPRVKSRALMWDLAESDMRHLAELMRHSDVTVNAGSTLTIDSAIMDTPIVNIGFDGHSSVPHAESVIRIYDFTHYANIVRTGGVRIARSAGELVDLIDAYLRNPALDREGRTRIVREQCFRVDGRSGQRVGHLLLKMARGQAAADVAADLGSTPAATSA